MSQTEVTICNSALTRVGAQPIAALTDQTPEGLLCRRHYNTTLAAFLRSHPWKFARKRAEIAASATAPNWGFTYAYPLPTTCLRVIKMEGDETFPWSIEGRNLMTDMSPCKIMYVSSDIVASDFDATFCEALSAELAHLFAYALNESAALRKTLQDEAKQKLSEARSYNGQEGAGDRFYADHWLNSRS